VEEELARETLRKALASGRVIIIVEIRKKTWRSIL